MNSQNYEIDSLSSQSVNPQDSTKIVISQSKNPVHFKSYGNFEQFIKQKQYAVQFFMKEPSLVQNFQEEDYKKIHNLALDVQNQTFYATLGIFLVVRYSDLFLRRKNRIYGLTYKFTLGGTLFKYFLIPQFFLEKYESWYLKPKIDPLIDQIVDKYDLDQPIFRNVYDDYKSKNPIL